MTFALATCVVARAQVAGVVFTNNSASTVKGDKPVASFTLPAQTNDVKDAIDEFQRFVQHEAWEKAFKSLETITSKASTGFVERGDGVLVPSRLLVRSLLAGMPPGGKSAYRVFYDAQATALWDKATGAAELENLNSIVNNHLASSVGASAADRLGDLYFERGELEQAVMAWHSVLDYCPDSKLSKAQLLVKIATALARQGRSSELGDLVRTLEPRFAGETVEVGGRRVTAGEHIARLAASAKSEKAPSVASMPDDITLPTSEDPSWQFRFQSKVDPANPTQPFALMDVYGRQRANDFPIPTATDGQRLYANVFGVEMAFDLATGKMLWRTGRLHQLNFQQNRQGGSPDRYSITVAGDRVWSVTRDPQQLNQQPPVFSLVAREAATGKEIFNSRKAMSSWNIHGTPHLVDRNGTSVTTDADSAPAPTSAGVAANGTPVIDFSQGFSTANDQLSLNGVSAVVDSRLRLTNGGSKQAASVFVTKPVSVAGFKTQFDCQFTKAFADGMVFVLQGEAATSLGKFGDGIGFEGVSKSVGVKFDLYGKDANTTGLCLDGARPMPDSAISLKGSKIDLKSGHVFKVAMAYDGTDLEVKITDAETQASDTQRYPVDIPNCVNGPTAFVGFTASSGNLTAVQEVLNWSYTPIAPLKKSVPQATGGLVYVGASRTNKGTELSLLVLEAASGKLLKNVTLGTHVVDPNQMYYDRAPEPTLLLLGGRLYVDTHAGALVSIEPQSGTIDWGIVYDSPPPQTGYYYYEYQPPQLSISGPISSAGLLFAKGMRSHRMLGVQADGPAMAWTRPVDRSAVLASVDEDCIYLGGEELLAYDRKTQELLWSTRLPRSAAWSIPVATKTRLYQFTSRGIYEVNKKTGLVENVFRGIDLDAFGGSLLVTPTALVTVSNLAITAYSRNDTAKDLLQHSGSDSSKP
jgi:outer membrane protein assembly factor BamB